jgi:hypothetical protein
LPNDVLLNDFDFLAKDICDVGEQENSNEVGNWNSPIDKNGSINKNKQHSYNHAKKNIDKVDHELFNISADLGEY